MLQIILTIIFLFVNNYAYCFEQFYLPLPLKNNSSNLTIAVGYNVDDNFAFEIAINQFKSFDTRNNQCYFEGVEVSDPIKEEKTLGPYWQYNIMNDNYKKKAEIQSNLNTKLSIILKPIYRFWHTDSSSLYFGTITQIDIKRSIKIIFKEIKFTKNQYNRIDSYIEIPIYETNNCDHTPIYGLVFGGMYQFHNRLKLEMELTYNWHDNKPPDMQDCDIDIKYYNTDCLPEKRIEISKLSIHDPFFMLDLNIALRISYVF